MALPPKHLLNSDAFIINRINANNVESYKVYADDIGIFLLETPQYPGSSPEDKYVNDGDLNVTGPWANGGDVTVNLHSANEYCEGTLEFKKGFFVSGTTHNVIVDQDFADIADNLACDGLETNNGCLQLDMHWLTDNIICDGGTGLEDLGGCIRINLCDHSGLTFDSADGCMEVLLCPDRGIIHHKADGCLDVDLNYLVESLSCDGLRPSEGDPKAVCMEIDMNWLSANIRCGDPTDGSAENGSGLTDGDGCIAVDACWVSDQYNLENNNENNGNGLNFYQNSIDIDDCIFSINMDWLAANIRCGDADDETAQNGSGLIHGDECIAVDPCWVSDQYNVTNTNPPKYTDSIDIDDCEFSINMEWLAANIRCGDPNNPAAENGSGLINNGECIAVDPCWVTDQLHSGQGSSDPANGSIDLGGCNVSINTDWLLNWAKGNINDIKQDGCITVNGANLFKGDVTVGLDENCVNTFVCSNLQDLSIVDSDGQAVGSYHPCSGGSIELPEFPGQPSTEPCMNFDFIETNGINIKTAQGICWHSKNTADAAKVFYNENNSSFRLAARVVPNDCSVPTYGPASEDVLKAAVGPKNCIWNDPNAVNCGVGRLFRTVGLVLHGEQGNAADGKEGNIKAWSRPGEGRHQMYIDAKSKITLPSYITQADIDKYDDYLANPGNYTQRDLLDNWMDVGRISASTNLTSAMQTEVSNFDFDNVIDKLGTAKSQGGLFRWGAQNGKAIPTPELFIDPTELGTLFPALTNQRYSPDSHIKVFSNEEEAWETRGLKEDPNDWEVDYYEINEDAIRTVSLVAIKRLKDRVTAAEAALSSRTTMLATLGVTEYADETAAAAAGLGQGEVYWDTTLNRMRAVT